MTAEREGADVESVATALFRHRYGRDEVPESFDQSRMSDCRKDAAALAPLIAERERLAAERAWDEGYDAGYDDAMYEERGSAPWPAYPHKNPHRAEGGER